MLKLSLKSGFVPREEKEVNMIPLFKKDSTNKSENHSSEWNATKFNMTWIVKY